MYWKMSTDLSRPLVEAMGQHDPLDALATLAEVQAASADRRDVHGAELGAEITNLADMCRGLPLATQDALGVGGLLTSAHTLAGLVTADALMFEDILRGVLDAALPGLHDLHASPDLRSPDAA